ncbi:MAG TPA: cytochrome c biogenesis protein ResB, partial [Paenibacillus sp.]
YKGLKAYQFDYDVTPILRSVTPTLIDKTTGKEYGNFKLDIKNPERKYEVGDYTLELKEKYMDFGLNDQGVPVTLSPDPKAPAFLFLIKGPSLPTEGVQYFYFPKQIDKERFQQNQINTKLGGDNYSFELDVKGMENVDFAMSTSYLNIRVDKAMPFIWVGAAIVMLGLIMGFYWQHRRIWLRIDDGLLTLGAHTNKNWFGIRREVCTVLQKVNLEVDEKSLENGGNQA